ncbi:MAG TPA: protein-L-isoaspartate O-methyltransferase, partial [Stellaceae bacterium]|nr:protein-L-isoaspartate O-methyltransferase [Stellaceae bacterium]
LDAFRAVAREEFVPFGLRDAAYADDDLPLAGGRWLIEPLVLARLVQEAGIQRDDRVLVAGCPSGYSAAIVGRLSDHLVTLDPEPPRTAPAPGAAIVTGPIAEGVPAEAPFDVILLVGAVPHVPAAVLDQLAEGGRLVTVLRPERGGPGQALIIERIGGAMSRRVICDAATPLLPGVAPAPAFSF